MNSFTPSEQRALKLLVAPMLGCKAFKEILQSPKQIELQEFKDGYDLVFEHPKLPVEVVAIGSPKVVGQVGSVKVRYVIRIESQTLRLHCRVSSGGAMPASFRQSPVLISVS